MILKRYEIKDASNLIPGKVQILQGSLNSGFELTMQKFAVITETELFNKKSKKVNSQTKTIECGTD